MGRLFFCLLVWHASATDWAIELCVLFLFKSGEIMKKIVSGFVLVVFLFLSLQACTVGNTIQIKNLKDEMVVVKARLDSLEIKMKNMDKVIADTLKIKNK